MAILRTRFLRLFLFAGLAVAACSSDASPPQGGAGGPTAGGTGGGSNSGGSGGSSTPVGGSSGAAAGEERAGSGGAGGRADAAGTATDAPDAASARPDAFADARPNVGARDGDTPRTTPSADSAATDPGSVGDGDFMVGPTYTASPDLRLKANAPAGFTVTFNLTSAMSTIYNGADFNPPQTFTRQIRVFVPAQYVDGAESPFMVSSDGFYAGLQTVVQNLADDPNPDHHVPPLVIIGIQNGPDTQGRSERSLEYDTVSDRYWQFVTTEVIPAALANAQLKAKFPNFKLTRDPDGRGGYGCSSGGPAVMGLAWFGDFNRVLSFSGSYTALRPNAEHPFGAWEYPKMVADAPLRPSLRIFLEVGQNDNGSTSADAQHRNWVTSNQSLAAALKAKGNHYRFIYAQGAGHCDDNARNQVMPEGMIWLWRGYRPK